MIAARARQRAIGRELRRMYDDVVQEPIPEDFIDLLKKIDESKGKKDGSS
ncbi:MAG TPA: NepR family anti-sigma factor [Micropepsaceae bacterium]|nr:NepR family anti-sigma factor [Micropepsaceae bacterium]